MRVSPNPMTGVLIGRGHSDTDLYRKKTMWKAQGKDSKMNQ